MGIEKSFELISQVGEEIVTSEELRSLLHEKKRPVAYDGFEPSGRVHIAAAVLRAINVNKMLAAGVHFKMLAADWHAWANNKLGGDLESIQKVGDYLIEVWKACGMDVGSVEFVRSSDLVRDEDYWKTVIKVGRNATLNRMIRCSQIMGRKESESLSAAQIMYPAMQTADIFKLGCDITQLGMDQRKVNMLARELGPKLGFWKPVVVSHHMLMGLKKTDTSITDKTEKSIEMKMSKSKPDSAIFVDDSPEDVGRKMAKAYCPEKTADENPVLEYCRYIIFEKFSKMKIERPAKFGGDLEFRGYRELEASFINGELHPADLKSGAAAQINLILEPVRKHFERNSKARELLEFVRKLEITR